MQKAIILIKTVAQAMSDWVGSLSLRSIVVVLACLIFFFPSQIEFIRLANAKLLELATFVFESPKGVAGVTIVEVPPEEFRSWQEDINTAGNMGALLSNILHSSDATVGIILDHPIDTRGGVADELLEEYVRLSAGKKGRPQVKAGAELIQRKNFLIEFLRNDRVVMGIVEGTQWQGKSLGIDAGKLGLFPRIVSLWLWPYTGSTRFVVEGGNTGLHYSTISTPQHHVTRLVAPKLGEMKDLAIMATDTQRLFTSAAPKDAVGGFVLNYMTAVRRMDMKLSGQNLETAGVERWNLERGIYSGENFFPTSATGTYIPVHAVSRRLKPIANKISLAEALARGAFPRQVLIAQEGSPVADEISASIFSINENRVLVIPWWFALLDKSLLLLLTVYVLFIVPRVKVKTAVLTSTIMIFSLLASQVLFIFLYSWWLTWALHVVWLTVGHILVALWWQRLQRLRGVRERADNACIAQAEYLTEKGELSQAVEAILPCTTTDTVLNQLYDIAAMYGSRREYANAINTLNEVLVRKKHYRDTEQKIAALRSMLSGTTQTMVQVNAKTKGIGATVVLEKPSMDRRVLGRYEIREELGRGAMGTVYLGFDPKISRKVAVKTLNYNQFQGGQLNAIKSRFFREAEAAGRLNHPHIVSIFDVGEESDLAFIAMDFVEGSPLSNFVEEPTLLPVFEVYRIISDVAVALAYAHENQIVHRDIKPGNIMYSPSPYQVKVTDFGIARLVDDSKTSTGEILGSPLYMAPEQLKGKKVNRAADVFSLGVTFYQLLTGKLPFAGENLANLTYEIIHGKHKSVRAVRKDLPHSAARIINQALQKNAGDRYDSATEMATVLKKAIKRDFPHEAKRARIL